MAQVRGYDRVGPKGKPDPVIEATWSGIPSKNAEIERLADTPRRSEFLRETWQGSQMGRLARGRPPDDSRTTPPPKRHDGCRASRGARHSSCSAIRPYHSTAPLDASIGAIFKLFCLCTALSRRQRSTCSQPRPWVALLRGAPCPGSPRAAVLERGRRPIRRRSRGEPSLQCGRYAGGRSLNLASNAVDTRAVAL